MQRIVISADHFKRWVVIIIGFFVKLVKEDDVDKVIKVMQHLHETGHGFQVLNFFQIIVLVDVAKDLVTETVWVIENVFRIIILIPTKMLEEIGEDLVDQVPRNLGFTNLDQL